MTHSQYHSSTFGLVTLVHKGTFYEGNECLAVVLTLVAVCACSSTISIIDMKSVVTLGKLFLLWVDVPQKRVGVGG